MLKEAFDPKIASLVAGAFSSLVAAFGYRAKVKHETRRTTKLTLFLLLEIRHHVYRFHEACETIPEQYITKMKHFLEKEGLVISNTEYVDGMKVIKPYLKELAAKQLDLAMIELTPIYIQTLSDLAKEDPILAYKLKGEECITGTMKIAKEHMDRVFLLDNKQTSLAFKDSIHTEFENIFTRKSIHELTSAIKMTALKCSIFTYLRCRLLLKGKTLKQSIAEPPNIDMFIQQFAQKIATHQKLQNITSSNTI